MRNELVFYNDLNLMRRDYSLSPELYKNILDYFKKKNKESLILSFDMIQEDSDLFFLIALSFIDEIISKELEKRNLKNKETKLKIGKKIFEYKNLYSNKQKEIYALLDHRSRTSSRIINNIYSEKEIKKHLKLNYEINISKFFSELDKNNLLNIFIAIEDSIKIKKELYLQCLKDPSIEPHILIEIIDKYSDTISFNQKENPLLVFLESKKIGYGDFKRISKVRQDDLHKILNIFLKKGFFKKDRKFNKRIGFAKTSFIKGIRNPVAKIAFENILNKFILKNKFLSECKE